MKFKKKFYYPDNVERNCFGNFKRKLIKYNKIYSLKNVACLKWLICIVTFTGDNFNTQNSGIKQ